MHAADVGSPIRDGCIRTLLLHLAGMGRRIGLCDGLLCYEHARDRETLPPSANERDDEASTDCSKRKVTVFPCKWACDYGRVLWRDTLTQILSLG